MDTGTIIGIIALVVSILGLFYTRKRTKIMKEQFSVVKKESEKKRALEEASKTVRRAINMIKQYSESDYFSFPPLFFSTNDILTYMHDNQIQTQRILINPKPILFVSQEGKRSYVKTVEDLTEMIKSGHGGYANFNCTPDILENPDIDFVDAFSAIKDFYHAYKILKAYDYVIDGFDNTVLKELKQTIDAIVETILNSITSKHEINFSIADKSHEILRKLQNEIVDRESVLALVQSLFEICDRRLSPIQKELFLKS